MQTETSNDFQNRLQWSLFSLRLGVFIVMFIWTIDKFVNPGHGAKIFEHFYGIGGVGSNIVYLLGSLQLLLVLAFVIGFRKRITTSIILLMHAGSTFSSFPQYFDPFKNLLFFAAWPMLAACIALYLLRDYDTKFSL